MSKQEKSINQFVDECKQVFGELEYEAIRHADGARYASKHFPAQKTPRLEISGQDFIALGRLGAQHPAPSAHAMQGMLQIILKGKY